MKIIKKVIFLERYGLNELAWNKEDGMDLINSIIYDNIGILGGDVYKLIHNKLIPLYENWSCEPIDNESDVEYYLRSKTQSLEYISNYSVEVEESIVFSLTFKEKLI